MSEVTVDRVAVLEKFLCKRSAVQIGVLWHSKDRAHSPKFPYTREMVGWGVDITIPMDLGERVKYVVQMKECFAQLHWTEPFREIVVHLSREGEVLDAELRRCIVLHGAVLVDSAEAYFPAGNADSFGGIALLDRILLAAKLHGQESQGNRRFMQWQL